MSDQPTSREQQLVEDKRFELRLFWKGLGSLVFVVALAYARQRWWV